MQSSSKLTPLKKEKILDNTVKNWTQWLHQSRFSYMTEAQIEQTLMWLFQVRDLILDRASIQNGDTIIDIGAGTGLMAFGAYERLNGTGKVIVSDKFTDCVEDCAAFAAKNGIKEGIEFLESDAAKINLSSNSVDKAVMRSVLVHILDKQSVCDEVYRILKPGGIFSFFEPIISSNTRYFELLNPEKISDYDAFKKAENEMMTDPTDALTNFDEKSLENNLKTAGFNDVDILIKEEKSVYVVADSMIEPWFNTPPRPGALTIKGRFLRYFDEPKVDNYINELRADLVGQEITIKSRSAYIAATK